MKTYFLIGKIDAGGVKRACNPNALYVRRPRSGTASVMYTDMGGNTTDSEGVATVYSDMPRVEYVMLVCGTLKCENASIYEKMTSCEDMSTLNVKTYTLCDKNNSKCEMFYSFRESNMFTFRVIFFQI